MADLSWHEHARGVALENACWQLGYDLHLGLFDLSAPAWPGFRLRWARARARYRSGGRAYSAGSDDGRCQAWSVEPVEDLAGPGLRLTVSSASARRPALHWSATLYRDCPFLVLELTLHNTLSQPILVESLVPLEIDPEWGGRLSLGVPIAGLYLGGWQSWSPAGWKPAGGRDVRTRLGALFGPMHDTAGVARGGRFRADLVGVLTPAGEGPALLAGLLSTADQFGALRVRLGGERPAVAFACAADGIPLGMGEGLSSERVGLLLAHPRENPLETYGTFLGRQMETKVAAEAPRGWCSWSAFGPHVGEREILDQLAWFAQQRQELPVEVLQIDDGWEKAIGDWEANARFRRGMKWLAGEIRQAGFTPGLWLAPLIAGPRSRLAQDHPEWLLQDERGRPVHGGFGSVGFCRGLDLTVPAVQEWLRRLIETVVHDWGYTYLKLDFLYGAALPARHHQPATTRAQALRRALEVIRQAAGPEAFLLGCGCPLGPAIGLVDGMRVGADVAPDWYPRYGLATPIVRSDPAFPATANTVRNTLTRAWTHRRLWLNDPDMLLLRRADSRLSEPEVRSQASAVHLSGGVFMAGDDMLALDAGRRRLAAAGLPPHAGQGRTLDILQRERPERFLLDVDGPWGRGWIVALFNWEGRPAELALTLAGAGLPPRTTFHLHEFYSGEYRQVEGSVRFPMVEPHGCRVALLRPLEEGPQWVGSTLHLVQGQEIAAWQADPQRVRLTLRAGRVLEGSLLVWWPQARAPQVTAREGLETAEIEPAGEGLWRVRVRSAGAGPAELAVAATTAN